MNAIRSIRERLGATQSELATVLGVTQGNVSFYEKGQTIPPSVAAKLIEFAATRGLTLSYDHVYGAEPVPEAPALAPAPDAAPAHPRNPTSEHATGASEARPKARWGNDQRQGPTVTRER